MSEPILDELLERETPRLYRIALRLCGPEEAEDLVQDTLLTAFRKWGQFEGRSLPSTWLYTIAVRQCRRRRRRRSGEPTRIESLDQLLPSGEASVAVVPDPGHGPLEETLRAEARAAVEAGLAGLPFEYRLPLVLKEIAEMPLAEIGAVLGLKEATVKTRVHRARLHLRKRVTAILERREAPPPDHERQVCLDLLRGKQEALDRGAPYELPPDELCTRCESLFRTLDLTSEVCRDLSLVEIPEILQRFDAAGGGSRG